jgi:hypothetical protein
MSENKKVKFHLPGLSFNYPINMIFMDLMEKRPEYFRENIEIGSFFGEFPTSLWNGGRFAFGCQCSEEMVKNVVKHINSRGVPVRYTYTNPIIYDSDLNDPYCNMCMQVGDNGMNEVMIFNPLLEEYIRKTYPSYKINSSTCKEIKNIDALNEELKKDYYLVVLDQNLNKDFDFLEKIEDKERIEILCNTSCGPNCTRRAEHYVTISAQQRVTLANREIRAGKNPQAVFKDLPEYVKERLPGDAKRGIFPKDKTGVTVIPLPEYKCAYGGYDNPFKIRDNINYVRSDAIWEKYVPMGFTNFKLEGRTDNAFFVVDNYVEYMCRPEMKDEARYTMLIQLKQNGILHQNRTWWQGR